MLPQCTSLVKTELLQLVYILTLIFNTHTPEA